MATQLKQPDPEPTEPPVNDAETEAAGTERDYEAEARAHGWVPKEDFKGDPERWVEAETFVKRADEVMPLLKTQNKQLRRQLDELKRQFRQFSKHATAAEERIREQIEAEMEVAVKDGNVEAVKKLRKRADELNSGSEAPKYTAKDLEDAFDTFREENPWYDRANLASASDTDVAARLTADRLLEKKLRAIPKGEEPPPDELLAEVVAEVREKFPALGLNGTRRREKPPSDVAAGGAPGRRGTARSYENLPAEAKARFDKWMSGPNPLVDMGSPEKTREYFVKSFDWDGWNKEAAR